MEKFAIAQMIPNERQCPTSPRHSRRTGSTVCLYQLLRKLHPRRLPTPEHPAHCPAAGPRSPLSLPHGDPTWERL